MDARSSRFTKTLLAVFTITLALGSQVHGQNSITNGLVAYYPFNGSLLDALRPTNTAVMLSGGFTEGKTGIPNTALFLDGNPTGGVKILNDAIPALKSPRTYSIWLRGSTEVNTNGSRWLFSTPAKVIPGAGVAVRVNGMLPGYPYGGIGIDYFYAPIGTSQSPLIQGNWDHLVITLETNVTKVFVNGALVPILGGGVLSEGISVNTVPDAYSLGVFEGQPGFVGSVSDFRFYSRALSGSEVQQLYEFERPKLTDGLVAYYPFNGNANDESGNNDDAVVVHAALSADRFGSPERAFYFDGSPQSGIRSSGKNLPLASAPRSISVWIKPDDLVKELAPSWVGGGLFQYGSDGGSGGTCHGQFVWQATPHLVSLYLGTEITWGWNSWLSNWDFNTWHQVVWTYSGEKNASLYVDGKVQTFETGTWPLKFDTREGTLWMGTSGGRFFSGLLDDFRFYNRALTQSEVQQLFQLESAPPHIALTDGLVANYPFNGNADDETGHGHDGRVFGATPTEDRFGKAASAYAFNGKNAWIETDSAVLLGQTPITFSFWARSGSSAPMDVMGIAAPVETDNEIRIMFSTSQLHEKGISFKNSGHMATWPFNVDDGAWHHFVMVMGEGNQFGYFNFKTYADGGLLGIGEQFNWGLSTYQALDHPFTIGKQFFLGGYFEGSLDDIRIYSRALSAVEARQLYDYESRPESFLTDGLVAHYPFSGNANDQSGNGNNGNVFGTELASDRFGEPNSAYLFDGVADYIGIPDSPSLNPPSSISVSAWIKPTEARANCGIVGKWGADDAAVGQWALWEGNLADSQGILRPGFSAMTAGTGLPHPQSGGLRVDHIEPQVDGNWHHLTMTYDGSVLVFYRDGVGVGSKSGGNGTLAVYSQAVEIGRYYHGANRDGQSYYFSGLIDDVRIYNRALSASEVQELYDYESPSPATPVLTWSNPADITYGTPLGPNQLNATANVPGTFVYLPPAGAILNAGAAQTLSVTFTPTDTTNYTSVTKAVSINVLHATPVVKWTNPASTSYGNPLGPNQLNATADVPGTFEYTPPAETILGAGAGQTLSVLFTPTDSNNYKTVSKSVTITVVQAVPQLNWSAPVDITYGTSLGPNQLNATADVAGTFQYTPTAGTILNAGTEQILSATFTPTDTANYRPATVRTSLNVLQATPQVTWHTPADIIYGTPLSPDQLKATANVPGVFTYSPSAGTILNAGTQTLSAFFTPTDGRNYRSITATATLNVLQATPLLTWENPAAISYGTPLGSAQLNATADVPGTFNYSPPAETVLLPGEGQELLVVFTPTDNTNYENATATVSVTVYVPVTITQEPASQTVFNGTVAHFSVEATGTLPLSYQWFENGVPIPNATDSAFTIDKAYFADAGDYTVLVSNAYSSKLSQIAKLTVKAVPNIVLKDLTPGGGIVMPDPFQSSFAPNSIVTLTAKPAEGWTFLDWMGNTEGTNPVTTLEVTYAKCYRARFGTPLSVIISGDGAVKLSPESSLYPYDMFVRVMASPQTGSYFAGWSGSAEGDGNPLELRVRDAKPVLYASFLTLPTGKASLAVFPEGFGRVSVTPRSNTYTVGQVVTNTAIPDPGQEFVGWTGDASGTENPLVLTMDSSKTITAQFTKRPQLNIQRSDMDGQLLMLSGEFDGTYRIENSTTLVDWTLYLTLTNSFGESQVMEPLSENLYRYFRAIGAWQTGRTATAVPTLVNGFVVAITVVDGGEGYSTVPAVTIVGGGGSGAKAVATILNGSVDKIIVENAGSGYTEPPTVVIAAPSP